MSEFIEVLSKKSKEDIDKLIKQLGLVASEVNTINKAFKGVKVPSAATKQINKTRKATAGLNAEQKEAKRLSQTLAREKAKLTKATGIQAQGVARLRFENRESNKRVKEAAILSSRLATEYQKQQIKLTQLIRVQQDLMLKQQLGNKLNLKEAATLKRTTAEINRKDAALKRTDESAGKFQRSVGNYRKGLGGAMGAVRSMTAALGLMGGAFLAVTVFRDAFKRIRDFDKSMQNLSGILGETRGELKDLERSIISVAGESVKTSNEVADLATSLITLGKTKDEVLLLLTPVNNLGIALQTTGNQAGELLIQTLNAFGKSAASGQEFADIIAKVRTTTALDFERIKDSLGFVAPTANALGLTLEQTAAILGTLNDNGIRAARAGRLMNSTFGRLNQRGISLNGALEAINNSTDKVATATDLFGVQSFSLGLILADNIEKTDRYTEAFENAAGSLESLTDEQLKSLDAQLKILDSTYESFILTLDSGSGPIAKVTRGLAAMLVQILKGMTAMASSDQEKQQGRFNKVLETQARRYAELGDEAEAYAKIDQQRATQENIDLMSKSTRLVNELGKTFKHSALDLIELQDELDEVNRAYNRNQAIIEAASNALADNTDETDKNTESTDENADSKGKLNTVLEGTVKFFEDIISALETQQNQTATTREEWVKYQEQIDKAKESLRLLTRELLGMEDQTTVNEIETRGAEDIQTGDPFDSTNLGLEKFNQLTEEGQENTEKLMALLDKLATKEILFGELAGLGNLLNIDTSVLENSFDIITDKSAEMSDKVIAGAEAMGTILTGIGRTLAQDELIRINNEIQANDRKYAGLIDAAQGDAEQQTLLREEQEQKRRELEQQRIEQQRKSALFEIAISTAVAIAKTFATLGFPAGILPAAAVAAIGLAQSAIVASRPMPEYKKGRKGGEDEYAILGDGHKQEAIIGKDGSLKGISPNKPTTMHLDKGDSVIPSLNHSIARTAILDSITMNANKMSPSNDTQKQINAMRNENSRLKRDIIGSLRNANFVNKNSTTFDMGHQFKLLKYKGK
jgi:hypothetical protein